MRERPFDSIDARVAEGRAMGQSVKGIARNRAIPLDIVKKRLRTRRVKDAISRIKESVLEKVLPQCVGNFISAVDGYRKPVKLTRMMPLKEEGKVVLDDAGRPVLVETDISKNEMLLILQRRDHGFKASGEIMRSAGVLSNPSAPVLNVQVNDNKKIVNVRLAQFMKSEIDGHEVAAPALSADESTPEENKHAAP